MIFSYLGIASDASEPRPIASLYFEAIDSRWVGDLVPAAGAMSAGEAGLSE